MAAASTRVLVTFYVRLQFPFQVAVFLQSVDELLEFMETWGFVISLATCQPGNGPEYIQRWCYAASSGGHHPSSSLAACIKVFSVLSSTRVFVHVLGRVLEYRTNR